MDAQHLPIIFREDVLNTVLPSLQYIIDHVGVVFWMLFIAIYIYIDLNICLIYLSLDLSQSLPQLFNAVCQGTY